MTVRRRAMERKLMWMRFEQMGICLRWVPLSAVASSIISASSLTTLAKRVRGLLQIYERATDTSQ